MSERDLDIVLFGVTGFVGRLTAKHLAEHAPASVRIGVAGRTRSKVEKARADLGPAAAGWAVIEADSDDEASLRAMAERTRVVISTVGPYATRGMPLVLACAHAGTDYVDLCGEALFVRESIDTASDVAAASGARIVHSCGFDSVPSDLTVMMAAHRAAADGTGTLTGTTMYASFSGGLSGGTLNSMREQFVTTREDEDARRLVDDPFTLSPDRSAEPSGESDAPLAPHRDAAIGAWVAPFFMESYNTRVVRRSNALTGYAYGRGLRYHEQQVTGAGLRGAATAGAVVGALGLTTLALTTPALDPLVTRAIDAAGEGPSAERRAAGHFHCETLTTTTDGTRYRSVVAAPMDPGYDATAVMLGESALALVLDRDDVPLPAGLTGGVLTPAVAVGPALAQRLAAAGFTVGTARVDAR